jgi:hypothetical protein
MGRRLQLIASGVGSPMPLTRAGLPDDCVLHGLRKTAARELSEAGCGRLLLSRLRKLTPGLRELALGLGELLGQLLDPAFRRGKIVGG